MLFLRRLFSAALLAGTFLISGSPALAGSPSPEAAFSARMADLHGLDAGFVQEVYDEDGLELERSEGRFKLNSDTSSFRIDTVKPEESQLVCNGRDVHYYEKSVDQVTVYSMEELRKSSPFWIVLDRKSRDFSQFTIESPSRDVFLVAERDRKDGSVYRLAFDEEGLATVESRDPGGQRAVYKLTGRKFYRTVPSVEFVFLMPEGVTVDDRR